MNKDELYSKIIHILDNIQTDDGRLAAFYAALAQEYLHLLKLAYVASLPKGTS